MYEQNSPIIVQQFGRHDDKRKKALRRDGHMNVTGLIMAGGRSERMRSNLGAKHKALVPVMGLPMLEWNVYSLLSRGIRDIVVATNARESEIDQYVRTRGRAILGSVGGTISSLIEANPPGTIGAVRT